MTIILQNGEKMEQQHPISSKYGSGTLHVTSKRLLVEIKRRGLVFYREHWQMSNIESRGRHKIRLEWPERNGQMYDFEFDAGRKHKEIVQTIRRRHPYLTNFSRCGITRVIYDERRQKEIRQRREKWASKKLAKAEKKHDAATTPCQNTASLPQPLQDTVWHDDAEMWRRHLLYTHDDGKVVRSTYVPQNVEDHLCWNDAWLVEQSWPDKSYWRTLNYYWMSRRFRHSPVMGGWYDDDETGAYCIPAEHVRFFHGYPYVRGDAFENPLYRIGFFIPTMTDGMIDDDILKLHWRPYDVRRVWGDIDSEREGGLMGDLGFIPDAAENTIPRADGKGYVTERASVSLYRWGMIVDRALGDQNPGLYGPAPTLQQIAQSRGVPEGELAGC